MRQYIIHPTARSEFERSVVYYEQRSPGRGGLFRQAVHRTIRRIIENPWCGAIHGKSNRYLKVHKYPFGVIYKHVEPIIYVAAIAHGSRRPDYWKRRRFKKGYKP